MNKTYRDIYGNELSKTRRPYKEPVFLFTSCSLRLAAYAGWYSAFGEKEKAEQLTHEAYAEWTKELGASRRFDFLNRFNHDMYKYIPAETMKKMVDRFFKEIRAEIKKGKAKRV